MEHGPCSMTSITKFKLLGGYHMVHGEHGPCTMLTSITKSKMLGGYASPPDHVHGPWSTFMSITKFEMLGGYDMFNLPHIFEI